MFLKLIAAVAATVGLAAGVAAVTAESAPAVAPVGPATVQHGQQVPRTHPNGKKLYVPQLVPRTHPNGKKLLVVVPAGSSWSKGAPRGKKF